MNRRLIALPLAAVALAAARVWLVAGSASAVRWACSPARERSTKGTSDYDAPRSMLCRAVIAVSARSSFHTSCLEQSLALVLLFSMFRIPGRVIVGVNLDRSSAAMLRAHAWVESGGAIVLGGTRAGEFQPLPAPSTVSSCPG